MFSSDQYELIDFGAGRKLERFGSCIVDRPCPGADGLDRARPDDWDPVHARYDRTNGQQGSWSWAGELPESWTVSPGPFQLQLKTSSIGHLGVFPEQAPCWEWIAQMISQMISRANRPVKLLNLFAYTGGSTLAAAVAGAAVVHVDAARNTVARARHNAQQSHLTKAPIRWIVDDVTKFVQRELRRGNNYDVVVLDPPTYGHGPNGETWKLTDGLPPLVEMCQQLTVDRLALLLLTCHTPDFGPTQLGKLLADTFFSGRLNEIDCGCLQLKSRDGRHLPCGSFARWPVSR